MFRRSSISNYIPHKTPIYPNYKKWCIEYDMELRCLFGLFMESINNDNNNEYECDHILFNKFRNMIYNCSSKYILKY